MLLFSHLSHFYQNRYALKDINLRISSNSLIAIVGPNGAGKTTILKIIAGLLKPTKGHYSCQSNTTLAYLPQQLSLDRSFPLTVEDVITMGFWSQLGFSKNLGQGQKKLLAEAIETVGLKGFENYDLANLSGGQFQRVLFARLMVQDADILLLDEAFAAVDERTTQELLGLLQRWHGQGKTILVVIHNISLVKRFFPQTLLLAKEVIAYGETAKVLTQDHLLKVHFMEDGF
jgi:zinc/manganese transport system ATP-binding protein